MSQKKFHTHLDQKMAAAYRNQKSRARGRGIDWEFTFETWREWWLTDDRWSRRGIKTDQLMMCRNGDTGPYSPSNVYPGTPIQNHADISPETRSEAAKQAWANPERTCHLTDRGSHPRAKAVLTPKGQYASSSLAADAFGFTRQYVARLVRERRDGWGPA